MRVRHEQLGLWMSETTRQAVDDVLRRAHELGLGAVVHVKQDRLTRVVFTPKIRTGVAAEGEVKRPPE